ncbi:hypothetical protein HGG70_05280 [Rhodobacteraceae bacterium R_SAG4]|nr:hypothetical protein [Rhodobacteraceae bacterium R_SAG4]
MMSKSPFKVGKSPASVTALKDSAPETKEASENFKSEKLVGMTFNMPESWHRDFKMRSVQEGMSMRELLMKIYDEYKRNNP